MSSFLGLRASAGSKLGQASASVAGAAATAASRVAPEGKSDSLFSRALRLVDYLTLPSLKSSSWTSTATTVVVVIATMLVLEQWLYRSRKAHLPGPKWTIPVIGKFMDSLHPSLENYMAGWNSGPLSAASVFHM